MNRNEANRLAELRRSLGMTQQGLANAAQVRREIVNRVENEHMGLSVSAATKAAPALGVHPGVLYGMTQLTAIQKAKVEGELDPTAVAERTLGVLRKLIAHFDDLDDAEGAEEMLDQLEALLEENATQTAVAAKSLRGSGSTFVDAQVKLAGKAISPDEYEVDDDRDLYGRALSSRNLHDPEESRFPDVGAFDFNDNQIDDGRDYWGRRIQPVR